MTKPVEVETVGAWRRVRGLTPEMVEAILRDRVGADFVCSVGQSSRAAHSSPDQHAELAITAWAFALGGPLRCTNVCGAGQSNRAERSS